MSSSLSTAGENESNSPVTDLSDILYKSIDIARDCIRKFNEGNELCKGCKLRKKTPRRKKEEIENGIKKSKPVEKDDVELADSIRRNFILLLTELGFNDEQRKIFKSDRTNHGSPIYFSASNRTSDILCDIFHLWNERNKDISFSDAEQLIEWLCQIIPVFRVPSQIGEIDEVNIFLKSAKKREEKLKKLDEFEENRNDGEKNKKIISDTIRQYVKKSYEYYFVNEQFVSFSANDLPDQNMRRKLYGMQYSAIDKWREKWEKIWKNVIKTRRAEKFCISPQKNEKRDKSIETGRKSLSSFFLFNAIVNQFDKDHEDYNIKFSYKEYLTISLRETKENSREQCRYLVVSVFSLPKSKEWEAIVPEDGDELIMRASGELNDIHFEFVKAYYILSYKECDAEATEQEKDSKSTDMESYFRILENLDSKYPKPDSPKFLLADILHHQSSEQ